ncbi:malectin domain-containing carbohydrate-binding protein [Myxosarcina sp. GI1(2024)]
MGLTTDFNQVSLTGLDINNPTSLQFGPDGRLYVSQQNGVIKIAEVQAVADEQGKITEYQVIGEVETIYSIKDIPNHNDNGDLNTNIKNRQVTGLVIDEDAQGNVVLYVSSSDPRIGGNHKGDKNLDTNSGIISRLTLTDATAPLGDDRWTKVDLVIGLPRSEENHSTNGMDIRTEIVNGQEHQIMYVASGGNTNKGAPSKNFAWLPEYYYSTAVLRVDLTKLEQLEATAGLKGGTKYVDSYVYALPTLNDPTRADDAQGRDTANGTTGEQDAEAGDTFGGNDGLNQAKYDPNGIVRVYSTGYRNHYDVVITKAGNIYTFDNGPNNGWGDRPLTADGEAVYDSEQIGTNNPNIDVNTGNDTDPDSLHLVTEGFYGGHPHPVYASGADAGLYTFITDSDGNRIAARRTDPSDPANDPTTTADDLPVDWDTVAGGFTHSEADVYLDPTIDGSLLSISSSSNGLTEYTASGISDNPNAEVLAVAPFNGKITFIELESDGSQSGTKVTDSQYVQVDGLPLDLTAVGNDGVDGSGQFAGTVWITQFAGNGIAVLTPGTPVGPDLDQDDDGLEDNIDPLQFDSANGVNTVLSADETLFWDFNPSDSGQYPGKDTSADGAFNIGLTGWMIDGVSYLDGLRNLDNTIRGGAPGVIQVKSVGSGDLLGADNTQQDAIQTGFMPAPEVREFTIKVPLFNPFSSDANDGVNWTDSASVGFTLGDGSMSNFLQIAVSAKNSSGSSVAPVLRVTYEESDIKITDLEIDASELLNSVDDDLVELFLDVDRATYQVTSSWRFQTNKNWSETQRIGDNPVQLDVNGRIAQALQGELYIDGVQSAPVVTLTATSNGSDPFTADFPDLTIESTAVYPSILIQETDGNTQVTEGGSQDSYSLVLTTQPTSEVTVGLTSDAQIALNRSEIVFTPTNWNIPQFVSVNAVDDEFTEGNHVATVAHSVTSADSDYNGLTIPELSVEAIDNDTLDVLYRINVGGQEVAAADGIDWSADTKTNPSVYRVGSGGANIYGVDKAIDISDASLPANVSPEIFQTERFDFASGANMQWEFDVDPGKYEVRLFFAETYHKINTVGERVFDVAVEDSVPAGFDNIDPFASAGQYSGFMLSHTATVTDGSLSLEFLNDTENPAIKGIEIVSVNSVTDNSDNQDIIAPFMGIEPVDVESAEQIGAARITITPNSGIQKSNYRTDSFIVENTGNKKIAAVYFDVSNALFPDTVFDPVGHAGDSVSRGLSFSQTGGSGAIKPGSKLTPFYGKGGVDGYEGMLLTFDPNIDGGYETGEVVKFGVDMDPNSIAGLPQKPQDIDGYDPRLNSWDIGGVSGAELINSEVHVLFTDGTTAMGELMGDGSQGGSVVLISQSSPNKEVSLTVNGIESGGSGSYSQSDISVEVSGQAGDTARVVLSKGFIQPFAYVDPNGEAIDLAEKFVGEEFAANNALQFQTVDVVLDGTVQDITSMFDFGAPGSSLSFSGDDELPIGLVASIIDSNKLPIGPVTEPIYLAHDDSNVSVTPEISIGDFEVDEGLGMATFTVNLSEASGSEVKVDFATVDDTAVAGEDYTATSGILTFAAGETAQTIQVNLTDDELDEVNETFKVQLADATGATITKDTSIATIVDNDETVFESELLYRINVGGEEVASADGLLNWSKDTNDNPSPYRIGSGGGRIYTRNVNIKLKDESLPTGVPEAIFKTERWDYSFNAPIKWEFDVAPGNYEVRLYLAEIYHPINTVGERVFDVEVEGSVPEAFDDIDIFASVGQYSGMMSFHTTTVADGSLSLEFIHDIQNPALKGIEILSVNEVV